MKKILHMKAQALAESLVSFFVCVWEVLIHDLIFFLAIQLLILYRNSMRHFNGLIRRVKNRRFSFGHALQGAPPAMSAQLTFSCINTHENAHLRVFTWVLKWNTCVYRGIYVNTLSREFATGCVFWVAELREPNKKAIKKDLMWQKNINFYIQIQFVEKGN